MESSRVRVSANSIIAINTRMKGRNEVRLLLRMLKAIVDKFGLRRMWCMSSTGDRERISKKKKEKKLKKKENVVIRRDC